MFQPRRTAPTFCKVEGQIDAAGIDPWTRIRPTRPWIADTILDRNDNDQSFRVWHGGDLATVASYAS
jgi:hypothetical protein